MSTKRSTRITFFHLLLIIIMALAAYANTFSVPFQFDDEVFIVQNPLIRDFSNFAHPSGIKASELPGNVAFSRQNRAVSYLTLWMNYKVGKLNVGGYHVVNLLIHIFNGMLVYALVLLTFKTPSLISSRLSSKGGYIALFSALIFVAHPVQTEAVTYIAQRFTSLVAFFYLAAVVCYVRWRQTGQQKSGRRAVWYAVSFIATLLAMKTKENAFTLPLAIAMYEFIFFSGPVKKRVYTLLPFLIAMLVIPLSLANTSLPLGEAINRASRTQFTSRTDYLFTEFGVILTYLRLLFFPVGQNLDYDYPLRTYFFAPAVYLPLIFLVLLFIASGYLLKRSSSGEKGLRVISFGIFWFFLTVIVESSIVPLFQVIYEHRVYLPSVGIITAFVSSLFLVAIWAGTERSSRLAIYFCGIVTLSLVFAAYARNDVWQNNVSLWDDAVSKSPAKASAYHGLSVAYASHGKTDVAIDYERIAVKLQPDYLEARNNLAVLLMDKERWDEVEEHLEHVIRLNPDEAMPHNNLGIAYGTTGRLDDAIAEFEAALRINPEFAQAHKGLSVAYKQKGMYDKAEEHQRRAEEIDRRLKLD